MPNEKELTIITPTYNRAHTLRRLYLSLINQTNKSFIWMVIDDGSKDNTEKLIKSFIDEAEIKIKYMKKENGGKASAINLALDHLDTHYCTCLDSDDWFSEQAVDIALNILHEEDINPKSCGFLAIRSNPDGSCMGGIEIPSNYKYITIDDLYNDIGFSSELICFYKTDIIKRYRFPVFENEKFIPPSWFLYKLCDDNYVFRTSWDCICFCEYLQDGLTKNKRKVIVKNPNGYTLIKRISLQHSRGFKRKLKNAIMFDCGIILTGKKKWFLDAPYKGIVLIAFPLAVCVYFIRFKKIVNELK